MMPIDKFRQKKEGLYITKIYNPDTDKYDKEEKFDFSRKILILEGIFLFHPKLLSDIWDKKIYFSVDFERADKRWVKREKERWDDKYFPETHPDSYTRLFKIAYRRYVKEHKPEKEADLIIKV